MVARSPWWFIYSIASQIPTLAPHQHFSSTDILHWSSVLVLCELSHSFHYISLFRRWMTRRRGEMVGISTLAEIQGVQARMGCTEGLPPRDVVILIWRHINNIADAHGRNNNISSNNSDSRINVFLRSRSTLRWRGFGSVDLFCLCLFESKLRTTFRCCGLSRKVVLLLLLLLSLALLLPFCVVRKGRQKRGPQSVDISLAGYISPWRKVSDEQKNWLSDWLSP